MDKLNFKSVIQIAFVVEDIHEALNIYTNKYGIGPWKINVISSDTVKDLVKHDNRKDFAYKVAMCEIGSVEWELVQPLDDRSIYADFLKSKGPGLHHIAFGVDDFEQAGSSLRGLGKKMLQSGNWRGTRFAHFATDDELGFIIELFSFAKDYDKLKPLETYPAE